MATKNWTPAFCMARKIRTPKIPTGVDNRLHKHFSITGLSSENIKVPSNPRRVQVWGETHLLYVCTLGLGRQQVAGNFWNRFLLLRLILNLWLRWLD